MSWLWWIDPNADFDPDDDSPGYGRSHVDDDDEPDTGDIAWPGHTFDEGPY